MNLELKQSSMRKKIITKIEELAKFIEVTVVIIDDRKSKQSATGVVAKYKIRTIYQSSELAEVCRLNG